MTTQPIVPGDLFARTQTIAGLRALADFLEANPAIPVYEYGWEVSVHTEGTDEQETAEVERIAALLDVTPVRSPGGHYTASRTFGRITYRIVHIPARRMAAHNALMTYAPAFNTTTEEAA
ncbi:hypothetical protein [Actinoallomurus sp. CA-150999]|uniref:hypothetical protein n=1 Tax=Actinoallomurus sp. CA-150999 TaxID=3239887 RepID=UPI003D9269AF